jgi:hypothetical protein
MQHHPILGGKAPEKPRETNAVEVVAALAQMPVAIVALTQAKTVVALAILAVGVLLLLIAFRRPIGRLYRGRRYRKQDDRAARAALPQLRGLVRTFGKLVDPNADNTLYALLRKALENFAGLMDRLQIPSAHVFSEMVGNVQRRLDDEPANMVQVFRTLDEFYTIVSAHSSEWIAPVFRSMPNDVREMIKPDARAAISSYRERYVGFHAEFMRFVEDLTASMHDGHLPRAFYVFRPDSLS